LVGREALAQQLLVIGADPDLDYLSRAALTGLAFSDGGAISARLIVAWTLAEDLPGSSRRSTYSELANGTTSSNSSSSSTTSSSSSSSSGGNGAKKVASNNPRASAVSTRDASAVGTRAAHLNGLDASSTLPPSTHGDASNGIINGTITGSTVDESSSSRSSSSSRRSSDAGDGDNTRGMGGGCCSPALKQYALSLLASLLASRTSICMEVTKACLSVRHLLSLFFLSRFSLSLFSLSVRGVSMFVFLPV
jgi:hypothetical protein